MGKNDIRFTAELQAASRRYINRLVAIADEFGVDRDEVVFGEVEALAAAIEGITSKKRNSQKGVSDSEPQRRRLQLSR